MLRDPRIQIYELRRASIAAGRQAILFLLNTLYRARLMAPDIQLKVCLYVAVDHRIRRLFEPVNNELTEPSDHVSDIEA